MLNCLGGVEGNLQNLVSGEQVRHSRENIWKYSLHRASGYVHLMCGANVHWHMLHKFIRYLTEWSHFRMISLFTCQVVLLFQSTSIIINLPWLLVFAQNYSNHTYNHSINIGFNDVWSSPSWGEDPMWWAYYSKLVRITTASCLVLSKTPPNFSPPYIYI